VNKLPDRPSDDGEKLPARQLSTEQFEMVIRRAAELQARSSEDPGAEVMAEEEVLKIGRELGLSHRNLSQALAEVRGTRQEQSGFRTRTLGDALVAYSHEVPGSVAEVSQRMERYLAEHEYMVVLRRLPSSTVFVKARGVMAVIGQSTSQLFNKSPPLGLENIEVSVQPLEEQRSYISVSTDLSSRRTGYAAGGAVAGGTATGVGSLALAIAIAPPAALLALPALGLAAYLTREAYSANARGVRVRLENLLDRLEHGELPKQTSLWRRTGF
jgi:hypothetical protein